MKTLLLSLFFSLAASIVAVADIVTKEVDYEAGGVAMKGFVAWDDASDAKRPGVLVVHEWWGQTDYPRKRATMLAEMGYVGMAVDMYGGGETAEHPKDAGAFSGKVMADMEGARERFEAAMALLHKHPAVDAEKTAAIGYCFGGAVVLHMARMGVDLDGVASFHGSLGAKVEAEKGKVKSEVLVCHGADDKFISEDAIAGFKAEMDAAEVRYEFESYPGALHGFTNPGATKKGEEFGIPLAYNEEADKKSWAKMSEFFNRIFAE